MLELRAQGRKKRITLHEEMEENDELPSAFEQAQRCFNIGSGRVGVIPLRRLFS